jgi:NAD-dependent SIR2 family protein deacetylase
MQILAQPNSSLFLQELGLSCPEDLFDYDFFQDDPRPFYKFSKCLYFPLGDGKRVEPSDSHRFLALLEEKNQLLRVYTQNIDGLEEIAGVSSKRMVYAHGSLQWASCTICKQKVAASAIESSILNGDVPLCTESSKTSIKAASSRPSSPRLKRRRAEHTDGICGGVLKPGVTFFGETLHDNVRRSLERDRAKADLLLVIGTSLSV